MGGELHALSECAALVCSADRGNMRSSYFMIRAWKNKTEELFILDEVKNLVLLVY